MDARIRGELAAITPHDPIEEAHLENAVAWVESGAVLCRVSKPANPPKHLVAYFAVIDDGHILLVDHKNAHLWLPTGGHVEPGEDPRATVARELKEELGLEVARDEARWFAFAEVPLDRSDPFLGRFLAKLRTDA